MSKPKFDIPLQISKHELDALIRMYGERLYRPQSEDQASLRDWIKWNVQRLAELVVLMDKPK